MLAPPLAAAHGAADTWQSAAGEAAGNAAQLAGMDESMQALREVVVWPIKYAKEAAALGLKWPSGVLLYGPPGTGKTLMVREIARECNARLFTVTSSSIFGAYAGESERRLRDVFDAARGGKDGEGGLGVGGKEGVAEGGADGGADVRPSIVFIDEIDVLCPKRDSRRVVPQERLKPTASHPSRPLVVIAATNRPNALDAALRRPGRFDREIAINVPGTREREAILKLHARSLPLLADVDMRQLAARCKGYVGADLAAVCREAALAAVMEIAAGEEERGGGIVRGAVVGKEGEVAAGEREASLAAVMEVAGGEEERVAGVVGVVAEEGKAVSGEGKEREGMVGVGEGAERVDFSVDSKIELLSHLLSRVGPSGTRGVATELPAVTWSDIGGLEGVKVRKEGGVGGRGLISFTCALSCRVGPSVTRGVAAELPAVTWSDIGGLEGVKKRLQMAVEWPLQHPEAFLRLALTPPRGVLLHGPPGGGKTMLALAAAHASKATLFSLSGADLFSMYVGEGEAMLKDTFRLARMAAPSVVFVDEVDVVGGRRNQCMLLRLCMHLPTNPINLVLINLVPINLVLINLVLINLVLINLVLINLVLINLVPINLVLINLALINLALINLVLINLVLINLVLINLVLINLVLINLVLINLVLINLVLINLVLINLVLINLVLINLVLINLVLINLVLINLVLINLVLINLVLINLVLINLVLINLVLINLVLINLVLINLVLINLVLINLVLINLVLINLVLINLVLINLVLINLVLINLVLINLVLINLVLINLVLINLVLINLVLINLVLINLVLINLVLINLVLINLVLINLVLINLVLINLVLINLVLINLALINLALINLALINLALINLVLINLVLINLVLINLVLINLVLINLVLINLVLINLVLINLLLINLLLINLLLINLVLINLVLINLVLCSSTWCSSLGAHQLGAHQLGAHQLGAHQLGAHQLGAHQLGAHQLGAHQLEISGSGGSGGGGGGSVGERLLAALLTEMGGLQLPTAFISQSSWIIYVPPLDEAGRLHALQIHTSAMRLAPDVSLPAVATRTALFTGADVAALCREAALAALRGKVLGNGEGGSETTAEDIAHGEAKAVAEAQAQAQAAGAAVVASNTTPPCVSHEHFDAALMVVRPSLTELEVRAYERDT
ncbi:unnamed protein product [Closterium sp. Naga37s-1]|nr:unnamed protein product [Closterium sp. Naga37s-1]